MKATEMENCTKCKYFSDDMRLTTLSSRNPMFCLKYPPHPYYGYPTVNKLMVCGEFKEDVE